MHSYFLLLWIISSLLNLLKPVNTESFTALVDFKNNFRNKHLLLEKIENIIDIESIKLNRFRSLINLKYLLEESKNNETDKAFSNPIYTYTFIKHLNKVYNNILNRIDDAEKKSKDYENSNTFMISDNDDYMGSIDGILRLQQTYKIPAEKIASGQLFNADPLTKEDCFMIGKQSMKYDYYLFLDWMNVVYNKGLKLSEFYDYFVYGLYKLGKTSMGLALVNEWLITEGSYDKALQYQKIFSDKIEYMRESTSLLKGDYETIDELAQKSLITYDTYRGKEFKKYEQLCRLDNSKVKLNKQLNCRYFRPHPYFTITPIKMEVVYKKPLIVLYHDLISESEMKHIKDMATPKLNRATVQNPNTGKLEFATYRISKSAWLKTYDSDITLRLNRRIKMLTNINLETAEELQVVNYGIGGHYEPHFDFARKREINSFEDDIGNRLATLIFYMSDVEAGGGTVFTDLGIKIHPVKGSAAFWWNLLRNGDGDLTTRHAACPVLIGSKWVMNKWFHERGNEFTRPCHFNRRL